MHSPIGAFLEPDRHAQPIAEARPPLRAVVRVISSPVPAKAEALVF